MVKLLLIQTTDETVQYQYFPEGKDFYGILSLNRTAGDINILKQAANDNFNVYLHHAIRSLERYYKTGIFPERDTIAWY